MESTRTKLRLPRPSSSASTDSGLGLSPDLTTNCARRSSRLAQLQAFTSLEQFEKSLQESFISLWHNSIPHDYIPYPDNLFTFTSLWPDTTRVQAWILSQMVCTSADQRQIVNGFLENVKLFAVRAGPLQLLTALYELGLIQPEYLLENKLTAFETALVWRKKEALAIFGYTHPENIMENFNVGQIETTDQVDSFALQLLTPPMGSLFDCVSLVLTSNIIGFPRVAILLRLFNESRVLDKDRILLSMAELLSQYSFSIPLIDLLLCVIGANVNAQAEETGRTSLHVASSLGRLEVIRLLLQRGANPNIQSTGSELPEDVAPRELRRTIIHILQPYRQKRLSRIVDCLINDEVPPSILPADFGVHSLDGNDLLRLLAEKDTLEKLEYLLNISFCPVDVQDSKTGRTLLTDCVEKGQVEVVELLLKYNANPAVRDIDDLLPLNYAVDRNDIEMVKVILQYPQCWTGLHRVMKDSRSGEMSRLLQEAFQKRQTDIVRPALAIGCTSDPSVLHVLEQGDLINMKNIHGETSAFIAAKNGQKAALETIVELGGDFWSKNNRTLETPLHVAAAGGFVNSIRYLMKAAEESGRSVNIDSLDANGKTPLHSAVEAGHAEAVKALLELGAASSGCFLNGLLVDSELEAVQAVLDVWRLPRKSRILRAIECDDLKALKKVWTSKYDHYFRHSNGDTPIMLAAHSGHVRILEYLLDDAEQEYRPTELDLNLEHDENVRSMIRRKSRRPQLSTLDMSPVSIEALTSERRHDCYQWIYGSLTPGTHDSTPTLFIDEHRLNHVSAINLRDGCCALHRAIEADDNVDLVRRLVNKDPYCVNISEHNGFAPLHLAVILRRKRTIKYFCQLEYVDFAATDLLGRMAEELVEDMRTFDLIHNARTKPSSFWSCMCDEEIPLSTADGLSSWTKQFTSVNLDSAADSVMGSSATISLFTGKTSASQDGLHEFIEKNFSVKSRRDGMSISKFRRESKLQTVCTRSTLFDGIL